MSLTHVRDLYTSTFLRQGSISLVRHRTLDVSTTTANAVVDFDWHHLIAKLSTCISVRCKDLGDICCTSWGIAHFVSNFVAMATKVGRGGIWFAAFYSPIPKKNPVRCTDFVLSYKTSYIPFCPKFHCGGNKCESGINIYDVH